MKNISDLFSRIKNLQTKKIAEHSAVRQALKKATGLDVEIGDISIKSGIVSVKNIGHTANTEIFMKKNDFLKEVASLGFNIKDIRPY